MREKARPSEQENEVHRQWLGLLQPVGLVVSPPALNRAGYIPEKSVVPLQQRLFECVERPGSRDPFDAKAYAPDLLRFVETVLGWDREDVWGPDCGGALPEGLEVHLETYGETLRPDFAAVDPLDKKRTLLLLQAHPRGTKLDDAPEAGERTGWHASPHAKFERLLAGSGVRVGLLFNGDDLRLVYTPEHQTSGHLTFPVHAMTEVGGRPILAALEMLLRKAHVFEAPAGQSLHEVLAESRNYQNEVSNVLAEQVLGALWELLRGFQAADRLREGKLLVAETPEDREDLYGGLLTALMRMVFLLYAEDQGLLPRDKVWVENYSIAGLHRRLRDDAALYPDTMDQRFGAWSALLTLCRLVHRGGGHGELRLPPRKGRLFDPDAFPFLEGRARDSVHDPGGPIEAPRVSDGCIFRVLQGLLVLHGERLSYRALDVEQIGSVYEAMMGYSVERMAGASLAVKVPRKGIPGFVFVDVERLLAQPGKDRARWLKEEGCDLAAGAATALKGASSADEVFAAVDRRVSSLTPRVLPPGTLVLQPGEERRRSGSHYTPRELTQPIVATTLRPVLEALGANPTPAQILDLKVCDPAMGSGAFLVEACRQLADRLVEAWDRHKQTPEIPPDETPHLHARRLIAQRCLYGVDKNPYAVDLAKLSLWLVTLARDHPFTFIDHALRHGDSLVGLTLEQISRFHWDIGVGRPMPLLAGLKLDADTARASRAELATLGDGRDDDKWSLFGRAEEALHWSRLVGDLIVTSYFSAGTDRERSSHLAQYRSILESARGTGGHRTRLVSVSSELRTDRPPQFPFHWEVEFPEAFACVTPGFDIVVGNPPYLGGTKISASLGQRYLAYLVSTTPHTTGNVDLAAFFLRRCDSLLKLGGCLGLVTTNSIKAGDSGRASLTLLAASGRTLAERLDDHQWPGASANVAYIQVVMRKGSHDLHEPAGPSALAVNDGLCCRGADVFGAGFVLDDDEVDRWGITAPASLQVVRPYIGGEEFNNSPDLRPSRSIIDFGDMDEATARQYHTAFERVEQQVKPARARVRQADRRDLWWLFATRAPSVRRFLTSHPRVLAIAQMSKHLAFAFLPQGVVFANSLLLFLESRFAFFANLQSRVHAEWVYRWAGTMRQDVRYTSTDCFETFPLVAGLERDTQLEAVGQSYYEYRGSLMASRGEGLTKTYNRFHGPDEHATDVVRLRELHAAMDRAVLDAYGWRDLQPTCDFFLDYEIDEEEWGNKKKPYRYRWPDEFRDEVLGRLLELNRRRAEEERLSGPKPGRSAYPAPDKVRRLSRAKKVAEGGASLFDEPREDDA